MENSSRMFDLGQRIKNNYFFLAFLFILLSAFCIFTHIPLESHFAKDADEGYYLRYSKQLFEDGLGVYPQILECHVVDRNNWIWPSPLRIGYFLLSSSWFYLFGPTFISLAYLSLFCFLSFLSISYYFSKKYFNSSVSILYVLLLAFSPLNMAMAKRALTDAAGNFFTALSVWLFLEFLLKKKKINFIVWLVCFSYAMLIREQTFLLVFGFGAVLLLYKYYFREDISLEYLLYMIVVPPVIVSVVWLIFCHSPGNILWMLKLTKYLPSVNDYSVLFCRGPWFRYVVDYILISPIVSVGALSFAICAFFKKDILRDFKVVYFLILFLVYYLLLSGFDYNKNIRYAINLDMFLRFFLAFFIYHIFKQHKNSALIIFWVVVALCILDLRNFIYLFCDKNIYDPISFHLLKARMFIP